MMKRNLMKYATLCVAMAAAVAFTACEEDDKLKGEETKTTETDLLLSGICNAAFLFVYL